MPSSDSTDHRRTTTGKHHHHLGVTPDHQTEHLPCPRCDSTNTKFCYYNNYNFSQPRHFCKSCRRYWTHGGTLRDIPVGGGSRKNAKRSRHSTTAVLSSSSSLLSSHTNNNYRHVVPTTAAVPVFPFAGDHGGGGVVGMCGSFTSLLSSNNNNNNNNQSSGIFGVGIGGFDQDLSFGLGRTIWPFSDGVGGGGHSAAAGGGGSGGTWQVESGEGVGECFVLPELAISTRGNGVK